MLKFTVRLPVKKMLFRSSGKTYGRIPRVRRSRREFWMRQKRALCRCCNADIATPRRFRRRAGGSVPYRPQGARASGAARTCRRAARARPAKRASLEPPSRPTRKSVVKGKSVTVRVDIGGRRPIQEKKKNQK